MAGITDDQVLAVLVARIRDVMALEGAGPPRGAQAGWRAVRFDEDLRADSLDLVEVLEGVETELGRRGVAVSLADAELADLPTVGDVVDALVARMGATR